QTRPPSRSGKITTAPGWITTSRRSAGPLASTSSATASWILRPQKTNCRGIADSYSFSYSFSYSYSFSRSLAFSIVREEVRNGDGRSRRRTRTKGRVRESERVREVERVRVREGERKEVREQERVPRGTSERQCRDDCVQCSRMIRFFW